MQQLDFPRGKESHSLSRRIVKIQSLYDDSSVKLLFRECIVIGSGFLSACNNGRERERRRRDDVRIARRRREGKGETHDAAGKTRLSSETDNSFARPLTITRRDRCRRLFFQPDQIKRKFPFRNESAKIASFAEISRRRN